MGEESLGVQRAEAKGWGIRNLLIPNFIPELQVRGVVLRFCEFYDGVWLCVSII